jgi:hypothetical protein
MTGKHHTPWWWRLGALWRRRGGRHHQESPPPGYLSEMVDGSDGWAHLVTVEAYAQGLREGTGFFTVLCGRRIPVASMAAPPDYRCVPCHELGGRA